jgi:hypothetical protein
MRERRKHRDPMRDQVLHCPYKKLNQPTAAAQRSNEFAWISGIVV